jgi:hypothetical protein
MNACFLTLNLMNYAASSNVDNIVSTSGTQEVSCAFRKTASKFRY